MNKTYYITTPIYYVNDKPHIGHSYTTIAADVLARFFRADGRDVHFLTGTDEHGIKIYKAALERGKSPTELADEVVAHFRELWDDLDISYDDFIRTTERRHEDRVQELARQLLDRDELYFAPYEGWYDEGEEDFVKESDARDNDYRSPISGRPLVEHAEDAWFFRLSKWVPKLIRHIESNPGFLVPKARRNEVLGLLREGVPDLCISRNKERLPWGVEMPNDPSHVVYVWIDALSNYITALGLPPIGEEDDERAAKYWPANVHLIGKDILRFHAIYWPCLLMALDIPLPKCVFAHGWWQNDGQKMSKSLGNFISREDIARICQEYSVDVYRYYLLRTAKFGADANFSLSLLKETYNDELANGVGNLLSRTVNMIWRYFDGTIPETRGALDKDTSVVEAATDLKASANAAMKACAFDEYLQKVSDLTTATNRYIESTQPFKLANDDSQRNRLGTILYTCAEAVRIILLYLQPFMPKTSERGLAALGVTHQSRPLSEIGRWGGLTAGTKITACEPLFPRKK